jgi:hypothetical protein
MRHALLLMITVLAGCGPRWGYNPPAPGFDATGSDARAVELADRTMHAMGGRDAWDATRYLAWDFFGARRHVWDRHLGDVRIEGVDRESGEPFLVLMNLRTREGRAWLGGSPVAEADRAAWLERGYRMWVNDSYWLVMPYKLKDTGVTLTVGGSRPMSDGRPAEVVTVTFDGVGVTPDNRYDVYIAADSALVEQWDFYASAEDAEPRFSSPWHDWRSYGGILLSGDRGERTLSDIAAPAELPAAVFHSPAPIAWPIVAGDAAP